jgi:hypothetical protein
MPRCASQQIWPSMTEMGHLRRMDPLETRAHVRFAPIATELLRPSNPPVSANSRPEQVQQTAEGGTG